jgi:hypothetical protein
MRRVYFIKPVGHDGPIKIGCSYSPDSRRSTLACWSPFPLEIVAEIAGGFDLERRFHARFVHLHSRREWFNWAPDLQAVIDEIVSGAFDIATLPSPRNLPRAKGKGNGWTDRTKRTQSYALRIRHAERRSQMFLPQALSGWRCWVGDPEQMAPIEAFLSDPASHGLTKKQLREEKIARLRGLKTPIGEMLIKQLLAEAR